MRPGIGQALVTVARHGIVDGKCDAHGERGTHGVPSRRHDIRQRPDEVGQDAGQRAAFPDEQPHLLEIQALERTQAPVERLQVVEGGGRAEIVLVDNRDRQAPLGSVPRDRHTVEAGADHNQVKFRIRQAAEVARHERLIVR